MKGEKKNLIFQLSKFDAKYKDPDPFLGIKLEHQPRESWDNRAKAIRCTSCGVTRQADDFPALPLVAADLYKTDGNGNKHVIFCEFCLNDWYRHFMKKYGGELAALHRICMIFGVPFDIDLAQKIMSEEHRYVTGTKVPPAVPRYQLYFRAIDEDDKIKNSLCIDEVEVENSSAISMNESKRRVEDLVLSPSAKRDRDEIVRKFHYDPFEKEDNADRGRLYSDLLTLYDDAMATDLVRQRAAIEIVKSFHRIDKIGLTIQQLQSDPRTMAANSKTLKELVDQKSKETKMVTDFSKDHGFAERYQVAKSKGAGTLSSIVRDGYDNHFDLLAVNRFDIETSNAMQQVADISAQAMFNQIQLTSDEFRSMIVEQRDEIEKLQSQVEQLREANRILREKQIKEELVDEYFRDLRTKGIIDPEIMESIREDMMSAKTFYPKDGEQQ